MRKTFIHFFTIADYKEEENWLRSQHRRGWQFVKFTPPCFYIFESCKPQDVIYRLDYKNSKRAKRYTDMANDFGWEYCGEGLGWLYFRKARNIIETENEGELFSDNQSKIELINNVIKTRFFPLCIMSLAFLLITIFSFPYFTSHLSHNLVLAFSIIFGINTAVYIFLITYCGNKLKKMKNKYKS